MSERNRAHRASTDGERDDQDVLTTTGRDARRGSFGPGGGAGMPTERSENFGVALRRLGTILGQRDAAARRSSPCSPSPASCWSCSARGCSARPPTSS